MTKPIQLEVRYPPPAKDGGFSIRNPAHPRAALVEKLREQMRRALTQHEPIEGIPVRMTMHYCRLTSRADALNIINGVADVIQKRSDAHPHPAWLIDDDKNIREFKYTEEPADHDLYTLVLETLE